MAALKLIEIGNGRRARVSAMDPSVLALVLDHVVQTNQITVQQILDVRRTVEMRTVALAALRRSDREAAEIARLAAAMRADFADADTRHGARHRLPRGDRRGLEEPDVRADRRLVPRRHPADLADRLGGPPDRRRPPRQCRLPRGDRARRSASATRAPPRRAWPTISTIPSRCCLQPASIDGARHEDHRNRNHPARRVRQSPLAARAHRRGADRARRDLLHGARRSRPICTRWSRRSMLGRDPLAIDRIAKDLTGYVGFRSTGAEMRGNSAFDIALWDLFGKVTEPADRAASRRLLARPDPHLQHLRRQRLYADRQGPEHAPIGGAAPSGATTISTPS